MRDKENSPLKEFFHNKYILAFLAMDIIAIVALVGVFINRSTRISTINFNVVPANATISVDGDKHYKNGQYDIAPGAYKIEFHTTGSKPKRSPLISTREIMFPLRFFLPTLIKASIIISKMTITNHSRASSR